MGALALRLVHDASALSYACTDCGALDSDGTCGPAQLVDHGGGYAREADWLCAPCSARVWGAYLDAVRDRRLLWWASSVLGWPARRCDVERARRVDAEREAGRQLRLWRSA